MVSGQFLWPAVLSVCPDDVRATPTETIINEASLWFPQHELSTRDKVGEGEGICVCPLWPWPSSAADPFLICFLFAANFLILPGFGYALDSGHRILQWVRLDWHRWCWCPLIALSACLSGTCASLCVCATVMCVRCSQVDDKTLILFKLKWAAF